MGIKKAFTKSTMAVPAGIALGVLLCLVVTFIGAVGITQLIHSEKIDADSIGYGIIGVVFPAALAGAWLAAFATKRLRLQVCLLTGAGYFLTLVATTALFFGGQYQGVWKTLVSIVATTLIVAFIPLMGKKKFKVKKRPYR